MVARLILRTAYVIGIVLALVPTLNGQLQHEYVCSDASGVGESGGELQRNFSTTFAVNGFTVELRHDPDDAWPGRPCPECVGCRISVRSPKGESTFEAGNFGIFVDKISGRDLNGNGTPDLVIESSTLGAHCCSEYSIVSLGESPGLLKRFGRGSIVQFQDLDADGRIEVVVVDGKFAYWDGLSHADSPSPQLILRLEGNTSINASSDYRSIYDKQIADQHTKLVAARSEFGSAVTKGLIASIALEYLFSGRATEAWKFLDEQWVANDVSRFRQQMIRDYCATVVELVGATSEPFCQPESQR